MNSRQIRNIAFFTGYPHLCGGGLFEKNRIPGSYPSEPFFELKSTLENQQWRVLTYDQEESKSTLDIIIFVDLPADIAVVANIKEQAPNAITILYILESPPHHPGQFNLKNYKPFDYVISYNKPLADNSKIFFCPIPFDALEGNGDLPFLVWKQRRLLCIINGRKKSGFLCNSGNGPLHRLGVRGLGEPWHTSARCILTQWRGYQYNFRNELVDSLDKCISSANSFDVFGRGWNGEPIGYWERFVKSPLPIKSSKGVYHGNKLELLGGYKYTLVIENWIGDESYVSEKLFEALAAGCVPIYWGDPSIKRLLPNKAFINGPSFNSAADILDFLTGETEKQWAQRLLAINHFKKSHYYKMRSPRGFAMKFADIIYRILAREGAVSNENTLDL